MMEQASEVREKDHYRKCSRYRDCHNEECIFFDGEDHCWARVSPFKLRRRPSMLLRETAEYCTCLSISCTECDYFEP